MKKNLFFCIFCIFINVFGCIEAVEEDLVVVDAIDEVIDEEFKVENMFETVSLKGNMPECIAPTFSVPFVLLPEESIVFFNAMGEESGSFVNKKEQPIIIKLEDWCGFTTDGPIF